MAWVEGSYSNPSNALPEKFWAAAMLYRATGEKQYEEYILSHYKNDDNADCFNPERTIPYYANDMAMMGYFQYARMPNAHPEFMDFFTNCFSPIEKSNATNAIIDKIYITP